MILIDYLKEIKENQTYNFNYTTTESLFLEIEREFNKHFLLEITKTLYKKLNYSPSERFVFNDFIYLTRNFLERNNLELDKETIILFFKKISNPKHLQRFTESFIEEIKKYNLYNELVKNIKDEKITEFYLKGTIKNLKKEELSSLSDKEFEELLKKVGDFKIENKRIMIEELLDRNINSHIYNLQELFEGFNEDELRRYFKEFYNKNKNRLDNIEEYKVAYIPYIWLIRYILENRKISTDFKKNVYNKNVELETKYNKTFFDFFYLSFYSKISKEKFLSFLKDFARTRKSIDNFDYNDILSMFVKETNLPEEKNILNHINQSATEIYSILKDLNKNINLDDIIEHLKFVYLENHTLNNEQIKTLLYSLDEKYKVVSSNSNLIKNLVKLDLSEIERLLNEIRFETSYSFEKFIDELIVKYKEDENAINRIFKLIDKEEKRRIETTGSGLEFSKYAEMEFWASVIDSPKKSIEKDIEKWINNREFDTVWDEDVMYNYLTRNFVDKNKLKYFADKIKKIIKPDTINDVAYTFQKVLVNKTFKNEELYKELIKDYKNLIYYDIGDDIFYTHPFVKEDHFAFKDLLEESKKQNKSFYERLVAENKEYNEIKKLLIDIFQKDKNMPTQNIQQQRALKR